nr:MAG TPA: hypothetical protein [Caudoviricetes sp.]
MPALLVAQQSRRRKRGRLRGRTPLPLEPRGDIEPPRPRLRSHGYGPAFCYSTRHMCASRLNYHTPAPQHRSDRQPVSHTDAVFSGHCHSL